MRAAWASSRTAPRVTAGGAASSTGGALPGIPRGAVLELAHAARIGAHEVSLTLDDLRGAEEAFLTNAVAGLVPLVSVDGAKVGSGKPGLLTRRLRELYEAAATAPPAHPAADR